MLLTANLKHLALYGLGTYDRKSKGPPSHSMNLILLTANLKYFTSHANALIEML